MPEGPEVEFVRKTILTLIKNKKIKQLKVFYGKIFNDEPNFVTTLEGQTIKDISRIGKYLIYHFNDFVMVSHLRMEGRYYFSDKPLKKYSKHDHLVFVFEDDSELVYRDSRKFGRFEIKSLNYLNELPLSKVSAEPDQMTVEKLYEKTSKSKRAIKDVLLDQTVIASIGNIYASEILYEAKIFPSMPANLLTKEQVETILIEAKRIIAHATKEGGSTVDSFESIVGTIGNYQNYLQVYAKEHHPCPKCGEWIVKYQLSNRGTYYCPGCQKRYLVGVTGSIGSGKSTFCQKLAELGYFVIECDEIVAKFYEDENFFINVNEIVGLNPNNRDKQEIANKVFANEQILANLNEFIHPQVFAKIDEIIAHAPQYFIIIEMPLLFETNYQEDVDLSVLVLASEDDRLTRLQDANKVSLAQAKEIFAAQMIDNLKKKLADVIIKNDGDIQNIQNEAIGFARKYLNK